MELRDLLFTLGNPNEDSRLVDADGIVHTGTRETGCGVTGLSPVSPKTTTTCIACLALPYPGNVYVSLHTADPGEGGDQTTNEVSYTSYARVPYKPGDLSKISLMFPPATGGRAVVNYACVGLSPCGPGVLLFSIRLDSEKVVENGVTLSLTLSLSLG